MAPPPDVRRGFTPPFECTQTQGYAPGPGLCPNSFRPKAERGAEPHAARQSYGGA